MKNKDQEKTYGVNICKDGENKEKRKYHEKQPHARMDKKDHYIEYSVVDPEWFFSDPDPYTNPTFQLVSDLYPDPV